jgi:hypothetical protein
MKMKLIANLKAQAGKLRENWTEAYTFLLIAVGLPAVAYVYLDWRAALTAFVIPQIVIGFLALKGSN